MHDPDASDPTEPSAPQPTPPRPSGVGAANESKDMISPGDLPPLKVADLPEPVPFRRMLGPSVILAGLALGSGEFVFWPYITYASQFVFFWACLLGVTTQFFINMEVARWSLATGETAIAGFARLSKHWAWVFLVLNIVPWVVPSWARGSAKIVCWIWTGDSSPSPAETPLAIGGLLCCGMILTAGKVLYETIEKVQLVLVSLALLLVVVLAAYLVRPDAIAAQIEGALNFGGLPELSGELTAATLLGALAFAGVGGTLNLCQSNYIKDKGYGMGRFIGRITSPITGQEEAISEVGYQFPPTAENLARWRRWWKATNTEHFVSFFCTCLACLVLLTLISYCIFYEPDGTLAVGAEQYQKNMSFIWGEAVRIDELFGAIPKLLFLLMGIALLLTTEFGVLDAASRVSTDIVKVNWLRESDRWTESRVYYCFLWATILIGCTILWIGEKRFSAFALFKFSAAMNGLVMFLYCITLVCLNRWKLPPAIRMRWPRLLIMLWAILFFGFFAVWAVWSEASALLGTA